MLNQNKVIFLKNLKSSIYDLSEDELNVAIDEFNISLEDISPSLLHDKKLAFSLCLKDSTNFEHLIKFHDDEDFVNQLIENQPSAYKYASKRVKSIQYIVENICFNHPQYFVLIPEKFKKDENLVALTFENNLNDEANASWLSVPEPVCSNKKLVKKLLLSNKGIYKYLNDEMKNDDILIKTVLVDYYKFKYLPEDKKENIDYMKLACKKSGMAIKDFTSKSLNSANLMIDFLVRFPGAIFWCGENIKNSEKIAIEICHKNIHPHPYAFFSEKVKSNREIAEKSILANVSSGEYLPSNLKADEMLFKKIISSANFNYESLVWFDESIKNSVELMQLAIEKDKRSLKYLGNSLKNNKEFIETLLNSTENNVFSQISKWRETFSLLSYQDEDFKVFNVFLQKIQICLADKTYDEKNLSFKSFLNELKKSSLKEDLTEGDCIANYYSLILKENLDSTLSVKSNSVKIKI